MPIIKDKYESKGSQTRSKYLTRKKNKAITEAAPTGLSTQQKQELAKENYRSSNQSRGQSATVISTNIENQTILSRFNITTANNADLIFTLNTNSSLKNIIIHNYNTGSLSSTINLYWTTSVQDNAVFTVSNGIITNSNPITLTSLFGDSFPHSATISLRDMVEKTFENVSKEIYFYCTSSVAGPSITISSVNG